QQGSIPWQKPWQGAELAPQNLVSRKAYRGVNVFLLHSMSYTSPYWLTFKQAQELGGHVRKGEKACPVVFWKWLDVEREGEKERVPFLRYYSVFNVAQGRGCPVIATIKQGCGYWDVTVYPTGGCFRRAQQTIELTEVEVI